MRVLLPSLICLAAAVGNAALAQDLAATPSVLPCPMLAAGPARTVVRVIDGETIALDDGSDLRLVGALAPRAIDAGAEEGAWFPETMAKEGLERLVLGKSIELAVRGDRNDRYGRILAQALLIAGVERRWVQGHMLEQGYARADTLPGTQVCMSELLARERIAREAGRGLWAEAAYQVRRAERTEEIARYKMTYQIVEGRIVRISVARGTTYLNFSRRWRHGFSAFLRSSDKHQLGGFASNPQAIVGRWVRVRGWIEGRDRPSIDISAGGAIEILDGGRAPDRRAR